MEIIYEVTFYVPHDWLKNKQLRATIKHICHTTTHARVLQTNRPLFPFDINDITQNLDCWQSRLLVSKSMWHTTYENSHPMRDSTHVGTQNSPSSSLWICMDQPPRLHETVRTVTKTNAIVKSSENTSFCKVLGFYPLRIGQNQYLQCKEK